MILTLPCANCGWNDDCPHNIKYCVINNGYKHKFPQNNDESNKSTNKGGRIHP